MGEEKKPSKKDFQNWVDAIWERRGAILSAALMFIGLVLSFFYNHIGAVFVGLGSGMCFFDEMQGYFVQLRDFYTAYGVFKSVMLVGLVLFFLIIIPSFVISVAIGFAAVYLKRLFFKKEGD